MTLDNIENLVGKVYLARSNYKWQGLPFWVAVAYVEIAILDMLGRVAGKSMGDLLGGRVRDQVAIYYASGNRHNPPEEEVDYLQSLIERSGAKAVKYRLGARMHYTDASTSRDLALIPLARPELMSFAVREAADLNAALTRATVIAIGPGLGTGAWGAQLLARVLEAGPRLARPGEFSERAFLNGRLDLVQAEAIADLIESGTAEAARLASRSLQGMFSQRIHALVAELIRLRTQVEAAIDFPEEDEERAKAHAEVLDALIIHGDGSNTEILKDAGIERADALYVGNMLSGELAGQEHVATLIADFVGLRGVEAAKVEAACASGAAAFRVGCMAVASGMADIVVVAGVEKMTDTLPADTTAGLALAAD